MWAKLWHFFPATRCIRKMFSEIVLCQSWGRRCFYWKFSCTQIPCLWACVSVCGCKGVCVSKQKYTHTQIIQRHMECMKSISPILLFFFFPYFCFSCFKLGGWGAKNVGQCFYGMGNCKQQLFTLHLLCSCVALMTFLLQQWQHKELFLQS